MQNQLQSGIGGSKHGSMIWPGVLAGIAAALGCVALLIFAFLLAFTQIRSVDLIEFIDALDRDIIYFEALAVPAGIAHLSLVCWLFRSRIIQREYLRDGRLFVDGLLRYAPGMGLLAELETACMKVLDEDCRVVSLSQNTLDFLGVDTADPFLGTDATDLFHSRDVKSYRDAIRRAAEGEITEVEYELLSPDGSSRWLSQRSKGVVIPGLPSKPRLVFCLTHEITQRKLANDRLDLAIDITRQGLWDEWIQTGNIYYNDNWFTMLGYEPGELAMAAQTWHELIHPDDLQQAQGDFLRHIRGDVDTYRSEYRLRTKAGSWKWIQDIGRLIERSENGTPIRAIGVHIDIDQTKRLELALRSIVSFNQNSSEDSVLLHICRTLTETLDIDIACVSKLADHGIPKARIVASWTPNGELPHTEYSLAGTPCESAVASTYCHIEDHVAEQFPLDETLGELNARSYTGLLLSDNAGEAIGLLIIGHSKPREGSNDLESTIRLIGARVAAELERYQIELELHQTRERLMSIADRLETATNGAGLGVFEYRFETDDLIWDETMHSLYGTSCESVVPSLTLWESRVHPDDLPKMRAFQARLQNGLERVETTFRVLPGGDQVRYISLAATATRDANGKLLSMTGVNWDISDVVRANQQLISAKELAENASSAKSDFLANMSHELRTPLTAIIGYTELLTADSAVIQDPEELSDSLRAVHNNANHLLMILNDILDLSKVDAGMMHVESVQMDPARLIQETVMMLSGRARAKHIGLSVDFLTELPSVVKSDPTRLRQILLNLIGNGIKFTESGGITVQISYQSLPDRTGMITIAVQDTGIGISTADIERLRNFDPFTQADGSMTRRFGGTGLGLRLSNVFAQKLGGCMTIESELGKGSTFTVSVRVGSSEIGLMNRPSPIVAGADEDVSTLARPHRLPTSGLDGLRLLLVEDGIDNQKLLSYILQKAGAEVQLAQNGREAVEIFEALDDPSRPGFDLVLMDMQMPEIDGYAATGMLRDLGFSGPILALTAHAMEGDRQRCIRAGCQDYLPKPVSSRVLVEACQKWADWRWEKSIAA